MQEGSSPFSKQRTKKLLSVSCLGVPPQRATSRAPETAKRKKFFAAFFQKSSACLCLAVLSISAKAAEQPEQIEVIGTSPLLGVGIDPNRIPAETTVLGAGDIARNGAPDLLGALNQQIAGVDLGSASGNEFQPNLFYHGFEASPLQGTSQGLAVYLGGVRFNQPFGDTVDWELIPDIAIASVNLEGSNPVFGLNALGGALNIRLKDGFGAAGGDAQISGGSFGRIEADGELSRQQGDDAVYLAGRVLHGDGWRDLQSSDIQNFYGDIGRRLDSGEVHLRLALANSVLNGPGTSPIELLQADPAAQFTAPNIVANRYAQFSITGSRELGDQISLQGLAYYDYLLQRIVNGNTANDAPCEDGTGLICSDPGTPSTTRGGAFIPAFLGQGPYEELDDQTTNSNGYGGSLQVSDTAPVFGLRNHTTIGASLDGAQTEFSATAFLGGLSQPLRDFLGPGTVIDEPGNNVPVRVGIATETASVFGSDTLNLTRTLAATLSGRFNAAEIDLTDQGGGDLSGRHAYNRFNPAAGITYEAAGYLTLYGGYSEAARAPTPAELSCAGPQNSCSLANFFVGDPDLKQVVAHTIEAGLRGVLHPFADAKLTYDVSLYRTDSDDDIAFVNSPNLGRAYFANVGQTRRQGVDISGRFTAGGWAAYAAFSTVEATYRTGFAESAGSNPQGDALGDITTRPGDRLPGIPANRLKLGLSWQASALLSLSADAVIQSGQYLFGDEANLTPRLPGFGVVNLSAHYQLTPKVMLFASVENAGDARYYTYGTFSPTSTVVLSQAPGAANPRSYSLAAPVGAFGGIKVQF